MIPYFCNCVISVVFVVLACVIQTSAKKFFETQRGQADDLISPRASRQIEFQNETQIAAMEEQIKMMWIAILSEGLINFFAYCYS